MAILTRSAINTPATFLMSLNDIEYLLKCWFLWDLPPSLVFICYRRKFLPLFLLININIINVLIFVVVAAASAASAASAAAVSV